MFGRLLHVKLSSGTWLILLGLAVVVGFLVLRYLTSPEGAPLVSGLQPHPFWEHNPHLEYVDRYPRTSFRVARDRASNQNVFLDLGVLSTAVVKLRDCRDRQLVLDRATDLACLEIVVKADTGDPYVAGVSFTAQGKQAEVAGFYREAFAAQGQKINVIEDSSRGTILKAEDSHGDTVAHVAIRESFGTAHVFVAWTKR